MENKYFAPEAEVLEANLTNDILVDSENDPVSGGGYTGGNEDGGED